MTKSNLFQVAVGVGPEEVPEPNQFLAHSSTVKISKHTVLIGPSHVDHSGLSVSRPTATDATTMVQLNTELNRRLSTSTSAPDWRGLMPAFKHSN